MFSLVPVYPQREGSPVTTKHDEQSTPTPSPGPLDIRHEIPGYPVSDIWWPSLETCSN